MMNKTWKFRMPAGRNRLASWVLISLILSPAAASGKSVTLPEALNQALAGNPALNAARMNLEASGSRVWEARSGYLPRLTLFAGYTRSQEPNIIIPIHEIGVFPPLDDQIYETGLQASLPVFNGGRTSARVQAAKASERESLAGEKMARSEIMEGIGRTFIMAGQIEDSRRLVSMRIKALRQRQREFAFLLKEGRISHADAALVNASVDAACADSVEIEGLWTEMTYQLGRLLGEENPVSPRIDEIGEGGYGEIFDISLPVYERLAGPRVETTKALLDRAEALKKLANRSFWPEVRAFFTYNYRSGEDMDMIGEWIGGITLQFPVFEGGSRVASRNAAYATARAAGERLKSVRQEQYADLQINMERWRSLRSRREYVSRAVEEKVEAVAAHQKMYDAGRVSLSDLLVQETDLLRLRIEERTLAYSSSLRALDFYSIAGTLTADITEEIVRSVP